MSEEQLGEEIEETLRDLVRQERYREASEVLRIRSQYVLGKLNLEEAWEEILDVCEYPI